MQWGVEAAKHAAAQLVERSRRPETGSAVDGVVFLSMAHFNLGIAIELSMKCVMTSVEGPKWEKKGRAGHMLAGLYDDLAARGFDLNECFHDAWVQANVPLTELAFQFTNTPGRPKTRLDDSKPNDLRSYLERFDKLMKLWEKRYDFLDHGSPSYFIGHDTFPVWYHFVNRVCDLAQASGPTSVRPAKADSSP